MTEKFHSKLPIDEEVLEDWLGGPVPEEKRKELGFEDQEIPNENFKYGGTN